MKRLKFVVLLAMLMALLVTGCIDMKSGSDFETHFETEDALFFLGDDFMEIRAGRQLSGLEVFLKADVKDATRIEKSDVISIVESFEDGTIIAVAAKQGYINEGETVAKIMGTFEDLDSLEIWTQGVFLESIIKPQLQVPEDGIYVQDTWVNSGEKGYFLVGAKNIDTRIISGIAVKLSYNPEHISVTKVVSLIPQSEIDIINFAAGEVEFSVAYKEGEELVIDELRNLFMVDFTAANVKVTTEVSIVESKVSVWIDDSPFNEVETDAHNGFITIGDPKLLGDFNFDGVVDTLDLTALANNYRKTYDKDNQEHELAQYDIGPAIKAYGGVWEHIYTEALPDGKIELFDLITLAQNWLRTKPAEFNYVRTLEELNAAIVDSQGRFSVIVFGADIDGTAGIDTVKRLVDINLNGYTLMGDLIVNTNDSGEMSLYEGYEGKIDGNLTVDAPNATFNNYAEVTGTVTINGIAEDSWNEFFCSGGDGNNLLWNAADRTLNVFGCVESITFSANANVTGGGNIKNAIIEDGVTVTFDEVPSGKVWNPRTGEFHTVIQNAINAAEAGDTLFVGAGEYSEVLSISKSLTIQGTGPDATIIKGDADNHSITLSNVSDVTIKDMGFDFGNPEIELVGKVAIQMSNSNDNINIENCHFKDGYYVTIQGRADNLTVSGCRITNVKSGINLQYGKNLIVKDTVISVVAQGEGNDTYCVRFGSGSGTSSEGMSITNCEFTVDKKGLVANEGIYHSAIVVRAAATGTLKANQSKILGEVVNLSNTQLDASCNWWGSADPQDIAGKVDGDVNWSPFWTSDEGPCDGYAPVVNTTKGLPYAAIQPAIDGASEGDTIEVAAGTYEEVLSISKSLTIQGTGPDATIIKGDADNHSITLSNVSDVTIKDMGFDFGNPEIELVGKVAIQMSNSNDNINIENCHFKDGYYVTIQGRADNLTVSGCRITNVKSGINLQYGKNLIVKDTVISVVAQGTANDTYCVRFGSGSGTSSEGMSITNCEFTVDKNNYDADPGIYHSAIVVRTAATGTLKANLSKILGEVVNLSNTQLDARFNWWGHETGPEHETNPNGEGDKVSDNVLFDPWAESAYFGSFNIELGSDYASNVGVIATTDKAKDGHGSWKNNTDSKANIYLPFPSGVYQIKDIDSISYHTNKPGEQTTVDFYLLVYTMPFDGGDESWYGYRLNAEPYFSRNLNAPAEQWNKWTTDEGANQLIFFDSNRTGVGYGAYTNGPTWQHLVAGSVNWADFYTGANEEVNYSEEYVKFINISTGTAWNDTFEGYLDSIKIKMVDGTVFFYDLEAD